MTNWGWAPNGRPIGLSMDVWYEGNISWDTPSVQVHMLLGFRAQFATSDTSNSLNWWGRSSGSKANPVYWPSSRTTDWKELEHTVVTVDLITGQDQWIEWGARLSGINTAGGTIEVYNGVTVPGRPYAVSQPTYSTTNITLGQQISMDTNRQQGWFTHRWFWSVGSSDWTIIGSDIGQSADWTPGIEIANLIPNSTSSGGRLLLQTFDGGNYVGDSVSDVTFNVPESVVPIVGDMVISDADDNIKTIVGGQDVYVQNNSRLKIQYPGHAGVYGSSGAKMETIIDGVSYITSSIDPWVSGVLTKSGNITVTKKFTDTRGRSSSITKTIQVIPYAPPVLASFNVPRSDSSGTLISNGTYGKAIVNGSVSSILVDGQQKNSLTYTIWSRKKGDTAWIVKKSAMTLASGVVTINSSDVLSGPYSTVDSYEFQVEIKDKISNASGIYSMPTEIIPLAIAEQGIGVGKAWERGSVDSYGDIYEAGTKLSEKYKAKYPAMGIIYKTDGIQQGGIGVDVVLDYQNAVLKGGMRSSSVSSNAGELIVPRAGWYMATANFYMTGPNGQNKLTIIKWGAQGSSIVSLNYAGKTTLDQTTNFSAPLYLLQGEAIALRMSGPSATWGTNDKIGTSLTLIELN